MNSQRYTYTCIMSLYSYGGCYSVQQGVAESGMQEKIDQLIDMVEQGLSSEDVRIADVLIDVSQ